MASIGTIEVPILTKPLDPEEFADLLMEQLKPKFQESWEEGYAEAERLQQSALTEAYDSGYNDGLKECLENKSHDEDFGD